LILGVPGLVTLPAARPSPTAIGALAALIFVTNTFAYYLYFCLLCNASVMNWTVKRLRSRAT